MDFDQLEIFLEVARLASFSRAGRSVSVPACHLSQIRASKKKWGLASSTAPVAVSR